MPRFAAGMLVLLAFWLAPPLSADQRECLLVEVDFEGVVDAVRDLGPLTEMVEVGSRMRGRYQIDSCANPSRRQPNSASYLEAIDPQNFEMEIGRVRFWPSRDARVQLSVGNDGKSGSDTLDVWNVHAPQAEADLDLEGAEITLFLNLADDTHSVFDSTALVTVPDLDRFGVSRRAERDGRTYEALCIAGELTHLRYIRSR
jgi:hypothetical protein